jgi:hypothetical protein
MQKITVNSTCLCPLHVEIHGKFGFGENMEQGIPTSRGITFVVSDTN